MRDWTLNADLDGTLCHLGDCLNTADVIATARGKVPAMYGPTGDEAHFELAIPLCVHHAHLLRGVDLVKLDTMRD